MVGVLVCLAGVCVSALALGQLAFAACGAREWTWLAPPVGLALLMLIAVPSLHVPGRTTTAFVVIVAATVAGVVLWVRRPAHRPPLRDVPTVSGVAVLAFVPLISAGRVGTLGAGFNEDMAAHLWLAETYRSAVQEALDPLLPDYPLGPHALAASMASGFGVTVDLAFLGLALALPILLGWTALAALRRVPWLGRVAAVTVTGIPYLVAAYHGQGAFKEVMQANFVLAVALVLAGCGPALGRARWVPFAVLVAGCVSVYSWPGLVWPAVLLAVWLVGRTVLQAVRAGTGPAARGLRDELLPGLFGLGVLVVALIPQVPRLRHFLERDGTGIAKTDLGNLIGPLPGWEALGAWNTPDFRVPAAPAFSAGMWTAFVLALVIVGAVLAVRRGRWMLPAAAGAAMLIWDLSARSQSPYTVAKALVIASPLLVLLAALAVVERRPGDARWWRMLSPLIALALVFCVTNASWKALRMGSVGDRTHRAELRTFRAAIGDGSVLFLGNDDYVVWNLAETDVQPAAIVIPRIPLRPEKRFQMGAALDFDSVEAAQLNTYDWVITTRDAASSSPPPQLRLTRVTADYALWRRTGTVQPRAILDELDAAGATLDCRRPRGRALTRRDGVAAVRRPSLVVPAPMIAPGARTAVSLQLPPGTWELSSSYRSARPLGVTIEGGRETVRRTLPVYLGRPGPRWRLGRVTVPRRTTVTVTFHSLRNRLTTPLEFAAPTAVAATPIGTERIVPLREACGRYVDWYRLGRPTTGT